MSRTRDISSKGRVSRPLGRPSYPAPLPGLDRDLTYYREGMRWSFSGGKILLDGYDVNELISNPNAEIGMWLGIAGGLDDYRKKVVKEARDHNQFVRFEAVIEALLGKVFGRLKKVYDEKTSGITWSMEKGQFILNGINVRSFLALYRVKRTEKARRFLEGLKTKLALILRNPDHEKIRKTVEELYEEITEELKSGSPSSPTRTLPAPPHLGR
ncbi:MAG: hypothetical protein HYT76_07365 [Deltaproteobacteria bacterium]|nr:hypothetical protein [Deltaproteobacteria bacterium]